MLRHEPTSTWEWTTWNIPVFLRVWGAFGEVMSGL